MKETWTEEQIKDKVYSILNYASKQHDYVYDPVNKTVNGKPVTHAEVIKTCIFKCKNLMKTTTGKVYTVVAVVKPYRVEDSPADGYQSMLQLKVLNSIPEDKDYSEQSITNIVIAANREDFKDREGILTDLKHLEELRKLTPQLEIRYEDDGFEYLEVKGVGRLCYYKDMRWELHSYNKTYSSRDYILQHCLVKEEQVLMSLLTVFAEQQGLLQLIEDDPVFKEYIDDMSRAYFHSETEMRPQDYEWHKRFLEVYEHRAQYNPTAIWFLLNDIYLVDDEISALKRVPVDIDFGYKLHDERFKRHIMKYATVEKSQEIPVNSPIGFTRGVDSGTSLSPANDDTQQAVADNQLLALFHKIPNSIQLSGDMKLILQTMLSII